MDGKRKRRCITTSSTGQVADCSSLFTRVCGVILPGSQVNGARAKKLICHVNRNGRHPFSIRLSSFLFPFKVRSFPCFLNGPPVKRNGQGKVFLTHTVQYCMVIKTFFLQILLRLH